MMMSGAMDCGLAQHGRGWKKIFCKMDSLRRVFLHSGAILDAYIAEERILVSLLYCTITIVVKKKEISVCFLFL